MELNSASSPTPIRRSTQYRPVRSISRWHLQGEAIKRAQDAGLLLQTASSAVTYVRFYMQNGPTADVRKALTMAVDIDSMVAGIYQYGEGTRASSRYRYTPSHIDTAYNDLVPSYDPEGAKKLPSRRPVIRMASP